MILKEKTFDFSEFAKKTGKKYVGTDLNSYESNMTKRVPVANETPESILEIVLSGNSDQIIDLSKKFVASSGMYQRILTYFATFLTNDVLTTPRKVTGNRINNKKYLDKYREATFFADTVINPKLNFPRITFKMLVSGAYYGLFLEDSDGTVIFKDLPSEYCRSRFKTRNNINVLEFDMNYFSNIRDEVLRDKAFEELPREFKKAYSAFEKDRNANRWFMVPPEYGVAFYYQDQYRPFFISMVPAIADLREYKGLEKKLDSQELERLLVQKIPIDKEGNFLLDTTEATELHEGVCNMLSQNQTTDILTTFAEMTLLKVGDKAQSNRDNLEKIERSVYNEAGTSRLLFASDSASAIKLSVANDMSFVLDLVEQYVNWLSYHVNIRYAEPKKFVYDVVMLPISNYNRDEILGIYLKSAQYGYSKLLPGIASGMKQSAMLDMIELENDILKLHEKMIPLQSSHIGGAAIGEDNGGRPKKEEDEKSEERQRIDENS